MKYENQEELRRLYPKLFSELAFGFECGNGWYELILDLSAKLNALIERDYPDTIATQVKEKFGELRFYLSSETDEMSDLINEAAHLSLQTCELCGKPGLLRNSGWLQVKCDECNKNT